MNYLEQSYSKYNIKNKTFQQQTHKKWWMLIRFIFFSSESRQYNLFDIYFFPGFYAQNWEDKNGAFFFVCLIVSVCTYYQMMTDKSSVLYPPPGRVNITEYVDQKTKKKQTKNCNWIDFCRCFIFFWLSSIVNDSRNASRVVPMYVIHIN